MPRSLTGRLVLLLVVLFGGVGLVAVAATLHFSERYRQEVVQKLNRDLARNLVDELFRDRGRTLDRATLGEMFHDLMVYNPSIELYIVSEDGRIVAYEAPPGRVHRTRVALDPVRRFLAGESGPILGDDPRSHERRKPIVAAPIPGERGEAAFLYVVLGGEDYEDAAARVGGSHILRTALATLAIAILCALAFGVLLVLVLTRRLRRLALAIARYESGAPGGSLALPAPRPPGDEIDALSAALARLSRTVEEQFRELRRADTLRRELVANVSHDLRTPLATLQAYVETLRLKDGELTPSGRREHLDTALRHCRRLSRLVQQLFELARLDALEARADCEPFALPELVNDVLQAFRLAAERQGVRLEARASGDSAFVLADIAMIERVLQNLIDNALRHTRSGGQIVVEVRPRPDGVEVRVADTGAGISPEDVPRVFDRFYQVERSRSPSDHAGLGLAIARRIVELHGSRIRVDSRLDIGTTFSFLLPAYAG